MSSTIFVNYSPDANGHEGGRSEEHVDSPVHQTKTGRLEKFCPTCEEWIGIGPKGGEYSFLLHRRGNRCRRTEQRKVQEGTAEEPERSFGIHPAHASSHVQSASPSSTTEPHPHVPSHESTHVEPHSHRLPSVRPPRHPCTGIRYKWELGNACKTYPFQYHETGYPNWFVGIGVPSPNDDIIELQSHDCVRFRDPHMEGCIPCINVPTSHEFKSVLSLASRDPAPNSPYIYLSWAQAEKRLREAKEDVRRMRRQVKWFFLLFVKCESLTNFVLERDTGQNN